MHILRTVERLAIALVLVSAALAGMFLVSVPGARADHNTIPWSEAIPVASSTGFTYSQSSVLTDGHGFTYVFYTTTNTAAVATNINVTKIAASSGIAGPPQVLFDEQVNTVANVVSGGRISSSIDSHGNLYVAWTRNAVSGSMVYVSKSADGGVTWDAPVLASSPLSGGSNLEPTIAVTPDGTVYVAWLQIWGGQVSVTAAQSTDAGQTFGGWTNVSTSSAIRRAAMTIDSGGRIYVASDPFQPQLAEYEINVTWSDNGADWSMPVTVSSTVGYSVFPTLYADSNGHVHAAWQHVAGGSVATEYAQSSDRGATWTPSQPITGPYSNSYPDTLTGEGDTVMAVVPTSSPTGLSYVISADHGFTWYPFQTLSTGSWSLSASAADQNGTFWATNHDSSGHLNVYAWVGPPSRAVIDSVTPSGTASLVVTWTPSPEQNVADYQVWRSSDGTTYQAIALVSGATTSYTDSGLANGTYYYKIVALNVFGTAGHDSAAAAGTVGVTVEQLQTELTNLQNELNSANANLASIQTQLNGLKGQISTLQGNTSALQNQINNLQNQINSLQNQQATQTMAYANLAFEIIVVVLLVIVLLNQMRKPKSPQMMMAQPGQVPSAQAPTRQPEDDL